MKKNYRRTPKKISRKKMIRAIGLIIIILISSLILGVVLDDSDLLEYEIQEAGRL